MDKTAIIVLERHRERQVIRDFGLRCGEKEPEHVLVFAALYSLFPGAARSVFGSLATLNCHVKSGDPKRDPCRAALGVLALHVDLSS